MAKPHRLSIMNKEEVNKEADNTGVKQDVELASGLDRLQSVNQADFEDSRTGDRSAQDKHEKSLFPAVGGINAKNTS